MLMPSIFGETLFDDLFDDFTTRPANRPARYAAADPSVMRTDIKEQKDGYELEIDLPGYKKEDIAAELKDGYLTITASSKKEAEEKDEKGTYIRKERYSGSCSRSFYVGEDITQEDIKAKFENGILKIGVPKKDAKPKAPENKFITIEG